MFRYNPIKALVTLPIRLEDWMGFFRDVNIISSWQSFSSPGILYLRTSCYSRADYERMGQEMPIVNLSSSNGGLLFSSKAPNCSHESTLKCIPSPSSTINNSTFLKMYHSIEHRAVLLLKNLWRTSDASIHPRLRIQQDPEPPIFMLLSDLVHLKSSETSRPCHSLGRSTSTEMLFPIHSYISSINGLRLQNNEHQNALHCTALPQAQFLVNMCKGELARSRLMNYQV